MATRPKDDLLDRARAAEEKLRRILESSSRLAEDSVHLVRPAILLAPESTGEDGAVLAQGVAGLDEEFILALAEPDGSVTWGLRIIPSSSEPIQLPDDEASLAPSVIDGIARAVPQVALAIQQGRVFELIGPMSAIEGIQSGMLEMIPSKSGGLLGGIRAVGDKEIVHQARFRPAQLAGKMGPGLAIVAASAVLGHMHMVEIRRQLAQIDNKVDRVLEAQQAARHGKLLGCAEVLRDVARSGSTGSMRALDLNRLAGAELELRQITAELEQLHRGYYGRTAALRSAGLASFVEAFGATRRIELNDARLYLAAAAGLVTLEQVLFAYAASDDVGALPVRESALQAATDRLASVTDVLAHLREFHSHCRQALNTDNARALRLSAADNDDVSEALRQDRLTVAELFAAAQQLSAGSNREATVNVVRVDSRGGRTQARVALLKAET